VTCLPKPGRRRFGAVDPGGSLDLRVVARRSVGTSGRSGWPAPTTPERGVAAAVLDALPSAEAGSEAVPRVCPWRTSRDGSTAVAVLFRRGAQPDGVRRPCPLPSSELDLPRPVHVPGVHPGDKAWPEMLVEPDQAVDRRHPHHRSVGGHPAWDLDWLRRWLASSAAPGARRVAPGGELRARAGHGAAGRGDDSGDREFHTVAT